jgi:hypothetical protein
MAEQETSTVRTFRGAKVRAHAEAKAAADGELPTMHSQREFYSAVGYEIAMANRHCSWAKRWFRKYRPGKLI